MTTDQASRAQMFAQLHIPGKPLVLFNVWDAGTAVTVARVGAPAIATGSWSVAAAHGVDDGEALALGDVLANAARIVRAVDVPVTIDFEAGYGATPDEVGASVAALVATGAIGINIEDRFIDREGLQPIKDQAARLAAARGAAEAASVPLFINSRTDIFLNAPTTAHSSAMVDEAIARAHAYADAGASGFFLPGLVDETLLKRVCRESTLPVNVMMFAAAPSASRCAELGVARISHGPEPYRAMAKWLEGTARAVYSR
ncbi:MAG: isocitrate lyase/phosphoenolpyruvate mutase family protein [Rhodocyclaceae bacterium]|nr:isocitrate lyase/phosphoenolpyruvate mutase family protein [Rhodocyclaceae bacterium]